MRRRPTDSRTRSTSCFPPWSGSLSSTGPIRLATLRLVPGLRFTPPLTGHRFRAGAGAAARPGHRQRSADRTPWVQRLGDHGANDCRCRGGPGPDGRGAAALVGHAGQPHRWRCHALAHLLARVPVVLRRCLLLGRLDREPRRLGRRATARRGAARPATRRSTASPGSPSRASTPATETHHVVGRALGVLGLGRRNLREIPLDADGTIDLHLLEPPSARTSRPAARPVAIVACAGDVNTGPRRPHRGAVAHRARARHLAPRRRRLRRLRAPRRARPRPLWRPRRRTTRSPSIRTSGWRPGGHGATHLSATRASWAAPSPSRPVTTTATAVEDPPATGDLGLALR